MKTGAWDVYPAIDLRQGRVVRLRQGDPAQETRYGDDPLVVAARWQVAGADWLHVVNLDGALDERGGENGTALEQILTTGMRVQFGGGLRSLAEIGRVLGLGVSRVVIGTAAVENPGLMGESLAAFGPERVAVGIDAREGRVRTHGWKEAAALTSMELAQTWAGHGGRWAIYTDVSRDGMGIGLDVAKTVKLAQETGLRLIGSGGVRTLTDVVQAHQAGLAGVIIGRALYEGQVILEEVLQVAEMAGRGGARDESKE